MVVLEDLLSSDVLLSSEAVLIEMNSDWGTLNNTDLTELVLIAIYPPSPSDAVVAAVSGCGDLAEDGVEIETYFDRAVVRVAPSSVSVDMAIYSDEVRYSADDWEAVEEVLSVLPTASTTLDDVLSSCLFVHLLTRSSSFLPPLCPVWTAVSNTAIHAKTAIRIAASHGVLAVNGL